MDGLKKNKIIKRIIHFFFLSCLKATELIEKKLYVKLSIKEYIKLTLHKSMCNACRLYEKQSRLIDNVLKEQIHENLELKVDIEKIKLEIKNKLSEK